MHVVKLARDLREFIELLNSHGVEYLVVGGHAVAFHGYPRYTGDIDFFVEPTEENAARLLQVLNAFGFGGVGIEREDLTTPGKVIQLGYPPSRIDLVTGITGVSFAEAWAGHVATHLDGLPVRMLGRDALLKNKRATGRAKDLADLEAIEGG
jgi:predicted nucleotidyltransferase